LLFSRLGTQEFPSGANLRPKSANSSPAPRITSWPTAHSPEREDPTPRFARSSEYRSLRPTAAPQDLLSGSPVLREQQAAPTTHRFGFAPAPLLARSPTAAAFAPRPLLAYTPPARAPFSQVGPQWSPGGPPSFASVAAQGATAAAAPPPAQLRPMTPVWYVKQSTMREGVIPKFKELPAYQQPPPGYIPAHRDMFPGIRLFQAAQPRAPVQRTPPHIGLLPGQQAAQPRPPVQRTPPQSTLQKFFSKKP